MDAAKSRESSATLVLGQALDESTKALIERFARQTARKSCSALEIDLRRIVFVTPHGWATLLWTLYHLKVANGCAITVMANSRLRKLSELSVLTRFAQVYYECEEAVC
jgi:ABC-type transporter Mla MlaB component